MFNMYLFLPGYISLDKRVKNLKHLKQKKYEEDEI